MDKLSINLLPTEVSVEQQKQAKFSKVQLISIVILFLAILLGSLSVAAGIVQKSNNDKLEANSKKLEKQVLQYQDKEATLVVLKNRVAAISQLLSGDHNQTAMFNLVTDRLPSEVSITTIAVDRIGNVTVALSIPNSDALAKVLNDLTSSDVAKQISKVDIESLAGSRDGSYKINLKIFKG